MSGRRNPGPLGVKPVKLPISGTLARCSPDVPGPLGLPPVPLGSLWVGEAGAGFTGKVNAAELRSLGWISVPAGHESEDPFTGRSIRIAFCDEVDSGGLQFQLATRELALSAAQHLSGNARTAELLTKLSGGYGQHLVEWIAAQLFERRLKLLVRIVEAAQSKAEPKAPSRQEPPKRIAAPPPVVDNTHWIEIVLVGEDGAGIPNQKYRIVAPDGQAHTGSTDDNGFAFVGGIPQGTCKVSFPDLDKDAWKAA